MVYMVTFTMNIPQMLAYIPYMDTMGYNIKSYFSYLHQLCWLSCRNRAPHCTLPPRKPPFVAKNGHVDQEIVREAMRMLQKWKLHEEVRNPVLLGIQKSMGFRGNQEKFTFFVREKPWEHGKHMGIWHGNSMKLMMRHIVGLRGWNRWDVLSAKIDMLLRKHALFNLRKQRQWFCQQLWWCCFQCYRHSRVSASVCYKEPANLWRGFQNWLYLAVWFPHQPQHGQKVQGTRRLK